MGWRVGHFLLSQLLGVLVLAPVATAAGRDAPAPIVVGDFSRAGGRVPAGWEQQPLARNGRTTRYDAVRDASGTWVLCAWADASASALRRPVRVDLGSHPILRWRWRVDALLDEGDPVARERDDYAARVYVLFDTEPARLGWLARARLQAARALRGPVPGESLAYAWARRLAPERIVDNPFAGDAVRMLAARSGTGRVGEWVDEERDVAADYRRAFGGEPPPVMGVALLTDADNGGLQASACYGDLTFAPASAGPGRGSPPRPAPSPPRAPVGARPGAR